MVMLLLFRRVHRISVCWMLWYLSGEVGELVTVFASTKDEFEENENNVKG